MAPNNKAAWLVDNQAQPLVIKEAPYTAPGRNELVVKSAAIAINTVDAMKQAMGNNMMGWIKYPFILGDDVAGEVIQVGPGVTRFQPGDRVLGHAVSIDERANRACEGAFQEYVLLRENLVSHIPENLSYEKACVLPLCLSTASCGLFMKDYLALEYPTCKTAKNSTGQALLVWGGSTSVGANSIQLAVAAGYEVVTAASPKNFDYVKKLGASHVFGRNQVPEIISLLKDKNLAGAIAIGDGSMDACIKIVGASNGRKFIAQTSLPMPDELPPKGKALISFIARFIWFKISTYIKCKANGVQSKFIWGNDLMANEVGSVIYERFLPDALSAQKYITAPEPHVVGTGLEHIQEALDLSKKSGGPRKLVVLL